MVDPVSYYSRREVAGEIAEFLRGRWAAVEAPGGRWLRWRGGRPLVVRSPEDVAALASSFRGARSFYGTIEVYGRLEDAEDVGSRYDYNVRAATPFIDVDLVYGEERGWPLALEAARVIAEWLCREGGVCRSVYLLWSGAGVHVRIHEAALGDAGGRHPVDAAFALVEYVLRRTRGRLAEIARSSQGAVKVENLIAPKRVFTAPLSLHRRLDRAAVAFKPEEAGEFSIHWTNPESPRHNPRAWRDHEEGEAEDLLARALREVRPGEARTIIAYQPPAMPRRAAPARRPGEPGRFPVMALLQAARYYLLTGDEAKAKSFGLNRAIFYAWAKYYGPARSAARRLHRPPHAARGGSGGEAGAGGLVEVLGERVKVGPGGWFMMGDREQTPEDFERNVARKFEEAGIPFEEAWRAALEYVSRFPESVLRDPQRFFKEVYEPVRDAFTEKVLAATWRPRPTLSLRPPGGGRASRPAPARRARSLLDWMRDDDKGKKPRESTGQGER